jgi:hypothetical protein
MKPTIDNHAINPEGPKNCEDCKETKSINDFIKYPKGINYDNRCRDCRKTFNKKRRDQKKLEPAPQIEVKEPIKRGRPKNIKEEVKQDVKEDVKEEVEYEDRICSTCNERKKLNGDFFHRKKIGYRTSCKDCINKKRRDTYKNKPEYRANKAKYQKSYSATYYVNNKEKFKEYNKKQNELRKEERRVRKQINEEMEKMINSSGLDVLD